MLRMRVAVRASSPVACLAQRTTLRSADGSVTLDSPLVLNASGDWFVSDALYLISNDNSVDVTCEAGGMQLSRRMTIPGLDAGSTVTMDGSNSLDASAP